MITQDDYFGSYKDHEDVDAEVLNHVEHLLNAVNDLLVQAQESGVGLWINPSTKNYVSGQKNGGFRPSDCPVGAPNSKHKTGQAVDIYDPEGELDEWCEHNIGALKALGLYIEAKKFTDGWTHFQSVPPRSGNRFFIP